MRDCLSPISLASGTQSNHRGDRTSSLSSDLDHSAPGCALRRARSLGERKVKTTAHSQNDPRTPQPWLPRRTRGDSSMTAEDFRPCRALAYPTTCRLSGKAMARTGLRMMPTSPSPPLKFRTASFPRYGFKAGISDKAFPKKPGLPSSFVPTAFTVYSLLCVRDDARVRHLRASGPNRSTPGALAPVRVLLSRSIIT
jgi:hypothetical protein